MKTFALDNTGDIYFDELNNVKIIDGIEEIKQRIKLSIETNLGEWFLDTSLGIAWMTLLQQKESQNQIRESLINAIELDEDVEEVTEIILDYDRTNRNLEIDWKAKLIDGTIINGQEVL